MLFFLNLNYHSWNIINKEGKLPDSKKAEIVKNSPYLKY